MELQELQVLYDSSQRERAELEEELQRCKAELEKLSGGTQVRNRRAQAHHGTNYNKSIAPASAEQLIEKLYSFLQLLIIYLVDIYHRFLNLFLNDMNLF